MALDLRNNFESGQSNGTGITTGNSGGSAGNAWDVITATGTGVSATYTTTSLEQTLSGKFAVTNVAALNACRATWNSTSMGGTFSRLQGGFSTEPNVLPTNQVAVHRYSTAAGQACRFTVDLTGSISLRDMSSSVVVTSSGTMGTSDKWWVTYDITFGTSASGTVNIYYSHASTTPDEVIPFSGANFRGTAVNSVDFGVCAAPSSVTTVTVDSCRVTDQGVPGPPTVSGTMSTALGGATGSATGRIVLHGTMSTSLGSAAGTAAGLIVVHGTMSSALGSAVGTADGTIGLHGTLTAALGGATGSATGTVIAGGVINGTMTGPLGGLAGLAAGSVVGIVSGTLSAQLGSLSGLMAGQVIVQGQMAAPLGGLVGAASSRRIVNGVLTVNLGGLVGLATVLPPLFLFTPTQRIQVNRIEGSLRYSYPVSFTVWKKDGVWYAQETPTAAVLADADMHLAVPGTPQIVDQALADELDGAGVGTITLVPQ